MKSEVWSTVNVVHVLFQMTCFFIVQHDKWNLNNPTETQTWAKIPYFVTYDFDPFKLSKLYFA